MTTIRSSILKITVFAMLCLFSVHSITGQSLMPGQDSDKKWNFAVTPYLWMAGLNGQMGIATINTDINAGFSDIFSNLDMAFMLYGEARYKRFGLAVDWILINMSLEGTRPVFGGAVKVDPKKNILETSLLFSFIHTEKWSADVHAGIRTWWINTRMETEKIIGDENRVAESNLSWVDPIIGAKAVFLPHKKWPINARADVGGFGAGSQFSWQVFGGAGFRFAKSWTVLLQYRALGVNYEKGTEGTRDFFSMDVIMHGPLIAVMATF